MKLVSLYYFLRVLKIVVLSLLIAGILLVGLNLITYSRRTVAKKTPGVDILREKVDRKEKIVHFEVRKGQRENFLMKADQHYLGEDSRYHLEGNVEVIFLRKTEGEDFSIFTSKILYDKALRNFWSPEETTIKSQEITLVSSGMKYSSTDEVIESSQKVEIVSDNMIISARGFRFFLKESRVEFLDDVHFRLPSIFKNSVTLEVMADSGIYMRAGKSGMFTGNVLLRHGMSQAQAQKLEFRLTSKENLVRWMKLSGEVKTILEDELGKENSSSANGNGKVPLALYKQRQEIEASRVVITSFVISKTLRSIEFSEGCRILFQSSEGEETVIEARQVSFFLNQDGGLKSFLAEGNAFLSQQGKSPQDFRILEGSSFSIGENKKALLIESGDREQVRLVSSMVEISAHKITLFYQAGDYLAEGQVRVILKKQSSEKTPMRLFDVNRFFYVTCNRMRSLVEEERYLFEGDVKMWQDERIFSSDKIIFDSRAGFIRGEKKVNASLSVAKKNGEKEKIEISSQEMVYEPEEKILVFSKEAFLKYKEAELESSSLLLDFDEEEGGVTELRADEGVTVRYRSVEGKGNEARFLLQDEILLLTGNPEIIHKDRGRTEGDKLTFYLADGRIIVENSEKERSAILIK